VTGIAYTDRKSLIYNGAQIGKLHILEWDKP